MELIKNLFPGLYLKRLQSQVAADQLKRYYDAAKVTNYRKKPNATNSPQLSTQQGSKILRDFARDLDENHDLAIGILDDLVNKIVGTGIPIYSTVKNNKGELIASVNEQIARVFSDWKRRPEASRTLPFNEMTRLICRTWLRDGETIAQRIKGNTPKLQHHSTTPYTLELIEADLLPYDLNTKSPRLIVQGIELNNWSQPQAFHLLKSNPSEYFNLRTRPEDTKRVQSDNIFHAKFIRRYTQIRGVSVLHGVITRLDDLKDYEESERIAARVAAAFTGYIKKSPDTQRTVIADDPESRQMEMSPGMIFDDLLPGEEVGTIGSNRPNPELSNFRNAMQRAAACGTGTNYSSISKNYEGSYSSQRQSMVESTPSYDKLREYFIEIFIRPMYTDFLDMAITAGNIMLPSDVDRQSLYDVDIRGIAMPWIDPKKEVEADVLLVDNGFKSRPQVIRERGGDPAIVAKESNADDFEPKKEANEKNEKQQVPENVE